MASAHMLKAEGPRLKEKKCARDLHRTACAQDDGNIISTKRNNHAHLDEPGAHMKLAYLDEPEATAQVRKQV